MRLCYPTLIRQIYLYVNSNVISFCNEVIWQNATISPYSVMRMMTGDMTTVDMTMSSCPVRSMMTGGKGYQRILSCR